jgi:hypothetical protein
MTATRDRRLSLHPDRMTTGKSPDTNLPLPDDPTANHLHAVLERCSAGGASPTWAPPRQLAQRRARLVVHGDAGRVTAAP